MSRLIDKHWEEIFDHYKILDSLNGNLCTEITSAQLNVFKEARLLTKIDHRSQLPDIFAKNNLEILPISRGGYVIGEFETFYPFDNRNVEIEYMSFPSYIESIDYTNITSEATALNCAFVSKIIHNFTEEEDLYPTVSGRMSSLGFSFSINSKSTVLPIEVSNSQIEIDGGYEGANSLALIEAKNYLSDDFIVRQLYYPYRLWSNKISKKVRPIFVVYSNGTYHVREYRFADKDLYNSIELVKYKRYALREMQTLNNELIKYIVDTVTISPEPKIPFPQADSFERVINLCEILKSQEAISKDDITSNYDFDPRQTDYYINAAKYLGLVENFRENGFNGCMLSLNGERIFKLDLPDRQIEFVKLILSHSIFNSVLKRYFDRGSNPSRNEIIEIMRDSNLHNVSSDSTFSRRSSTVSSWVDWIIEQNEV